MPRLQLYQYQPLREKRSIRILEVLPFAFGTDVTHGRIREVSLDEAPSYEAVSYVWGSTAAARKFRCDDGYLRLTEQCWRMIRSMRLKTRSRFLWIDACCIDQKSDKERSHQVGMMGDIYSSARRVLVWLGESRQGDYTLELRVMRYIRKIGQGRSEGDTTPLTTPGYSDKKSSI